MDIKKIITGVNNGSLIIKIIITAKQIKKEFNILIAANIIVVNAFVFWDKLLMISFEPY